MPTAYEFSPERLQEVKNDINIISTHTKWLLSLIAAIALALASFVFTDLGELHIIYKELSQPDLFLKIFAGSLLVLYSFFIMFFTPLLLLGMKPPPDNGAKSLSARIEENHKRLIVINKRYRRLVYSFIASPFLIAAFAFCFTYLV